MAKFEMQFGFERSLVRLRDGAFFSPMKEATERWVLRLRNGHESIVGLSYEILYRLNDRRFVWLRYECCEPAYANVRIEDNFWTSTSPAQGEFLEDRVAANWFVRYQQPLPDDLHAALSVPPPKPKPRPLSYWVELGLPGMKTDIDALEVQRVERAKAVFSHLLTATHHLASTNDDSIAFQAREFRYLGRMLYDKFKVRPESWWGTKETLPPSHVSLIDLPWTPEEQAVLAPLSAIFARLHEPLAGQAGTMLSLNGSARPTAEEQEMGFAALQVAFREIEAATIQLGKELAAYQPAVTSAAPKTKKKANPKRGSRAANIEKLEKELTLHIEAAKSHAIATKGATGVPELLPRPLQIKLGERCGIKPSAVTRCFQDETAKQLNLLWQMANDLDAIMSLGSRRRTRT